MTRLVRNTLVIMSGTLASRVLGVVRQAVFNNLFTDPLKDAFNVAYRVPNLFREVVAEGAVTNALVPILKSLPPHEARVFAQRFGAALLGVNLLLLGLGWAGAPWIADLLVADTSALDLELVTYLIRLVMPFLTAISMSALFSALLHADERFFAPSFAPIAFNVGAILLMLAWPGSPLALGLAFTVGGALQALVQWPYLRGYRPVFRWHPAIARAARLMGPFVFTTSVRQLLTVVLTVILTGFPQAAVTGFYNAEMVYLMGLGLLAVSPATALYPRLAAAAARGEAEAFRGLLERGLVRMSVLLGGAAGLLAGLAPWVIQTLYAWTPRFSPENARFSTEALAALALALVPWGLYTLLVRAHYAREEVVAAVRVSIAVFLLNTLGYALLAPHGMYTLNLATTVAGGVGLVWLSGRLARLGVLNARSLGFVLARVGAAAVVAGTLAYRTAQALGPAGSALESLLPLAGGGAVGLGAYLLLARLLGLPVSLRR